MFLIFFIGETYYRFYVDRTDSFAISKISQRWIKRHYKINNVQLRDNVNYAFKIEKGKYRISVMGDSFTVGHGIKNVDNRFTNILRSKYPNLEVHNMGMNGASTNTQVGVLKSLRKKQYEFNITLYVYCLNDIDYLLTKAQETYNRIHSFTKEQSFLVKESYFINTLTFCLYAYFDKDISSYHNYLTNAYEGENFEKHKKNLDKIVALTRESRSPLIVVTFPFLKVPYEKYAFKNVHKKLDEYWKSKNVPHLDLLEHLKPYMGEQLTVNEFDAHPNEFANELAAKAIDDFFKLSPEK